MNILAVDPGPIQSAAVVWDGEQIVSMYIAESPDELLRLIHKFWRDTNGTGVLAIEHIRGYGLSVGNEVFDTCVLVGRCFECWKWSGCSAFEALLIERKKIKAHLCNTTTAKDKDVRAALVARYGDPRVKKQTGILEGVATHLWAALAVAVYVSDTMPARKEGWVA